MSSELIERLRMAQSLAVSHPHFANISNTCRQAADALEAAASRERELEKKLEESHLQEISTVGQLQVALERVAEFRRALVIALALAGPEDAILALHRRPNESTQARNRRLLHEAHVPLYSDAAMAGEE